MNPEKSFFGRGGIEYLGYWVTSKGVQPQTKKVNSILAMQEPTNRKQLWGLIGHSYEHHAQALMMVVEVRCAEGPQHHGPRTQMHLGHRAPTFAFTSSIRIEESTRLSDAS